MSHKATNWAVQVRGIKPASKVVLWHLADRHNKDTGRCDPSQELLAEDCEMSRASVNRHLSDLENAGFIKRIQRINSVTKRQESTAYILCFDVRDAQDSESRVSECDTEAVSQNDADPCLKMDESRVSNCDTNPVREPVKEPIKDFGAFWELWPHKVGKDKARAAFKRLSQQNQNLAIERLSAWLKGWRKQYPDANHIHASTYLNGKRWQDEFGDSQQAPQASGAILEQYGKAIRDCGPDYMLRAVTGDLVSQIVAANHATPEECRKAGVL